MTTQIANKQITNQLNLTSSCGCGSWACEECFPLPIKPVPVENAWNKPLVVPKPLIDLESIESQSVEDNHWTKERKDEVVQAGKWKEISRKPVPKDRNITCRDCKKDFVYDMNQQQTYKKRGWKQPKSCRECVYQRNIKKKA